MTSTSKTVEDSFQWHDLQRTSLLDRKRECAELTIPRVLPPMSFVEGSALPVPLSNAPALGASSLSAKVLGAVIPLNGTPLWDYTIPNDPAQPETYTNMLKVVVEGEAALFEALRASNFRSEFGNVSLALVIVGDSCLVQGDDMKFFTIRLDNYIVVRNPDGSPYLIITREWVDPTTLPAAWTKDTPPSTNASIRQEPVFTEYCYDATSKKWKVRKEFRRKGVTADGAVGEYEVLPVYPLCVNRLSGENYGRSPTEDQLGDLRTLSAMTKGLIESGAAASEFWIGVNPAGITEIADLDGKPSGSYVPARKEDIFTISADNAPVVQQIMAVIQQLENRILQAYLYNPYQNTSRDRVTAAEITTSTQQTEGGMVGLLAAITYDLYLALAHRTTVTQSTVNESIRKIYELIKSGDAGIRIKTGLEVLGREIRAARLTQTVDGMSRYPITEDIKWGEVAKEQFLAIGYNPDRFIKTTEEKKAESDQAMQGRIAEQGGIAAAQGVAQKALQPQAPQ